MTKVKHNLKEREGEKIGGGFIVMRRHSSSGRVSICPSGLPFEHPDLPSATLQAATLAVRNPGKSFCIMQQVYGPVVSEPEAKP